MKYILVLVAFILCGLFTFWAWPKGNIKVCNGTPYNLQVAAAFNTKAGFNISGYVPLGAGNCITRSVFLKEALDPKFYVHAKGTLEGNKHPSYSDQNFLMRFEQDVAAFRGRAPLELEKFGGIHFNQGGEKQPDIISCVPILPGIFLPDSLITKKKKAALTVSKQVGIDGLTESESVQGECATGETVGGFFLAGRNPEPFEGRTSSIFNAGEKHWIHPILNAFRRDWVHVFEHPDWAFADVDPQNPHKNVSLILNRANATRRSLERQIIAEKYFSNREPMALFGAKLEDSNSNLNPGISVLDVAAVDIFQEPQNLRAGDLIVSVNGTPVFSISEALHQLQLHASQLAKGIDVPVMLEVRNEWECLSGCIKPTRYFFNARSLREISGLEAGYYGFVDMLTFGAGASSTCGAKQLGTAAGNILSGAIELIGSKIEEREFNRSSTRVFETENFDLCRWKTIQRKAFSRQTKLDYYDSASYLGFVTPGGVRMLFTKSARKGTAKTVGKGMMSRSLADAGLEAAETMLWAMGTSAPGTSISNRFSNAMKVAPIGAGLGFATGFVGETLKFGKKK